MSNNVVPPGFYRCMADVTCGTGKCGQILPSGMSCDHLGGGQGDRDYDWREVEIGPAMEWGRGRAIVSSDFFGPWPDPGRIDSSSAVEFDDGSVVVCTSEWRGPYSPTTPDVDGEPPRFWIGILRAHPVSE